jgi:hypothetical protein
MAHTHFIHIGKAQGYPQPAGRQVFSNLVHLAADIPCGPANKGEKFRLNTPSKYLWFFITHCRIIKKCSFFTIVFRPITLLKIQNRTSSYRFVRIERSMTVQTRQMLLLGSSLILLSARVYCFL